MHNFYLFNFCICILSQVVLSATAEVVCPSPADLRGCTCEEAWMDGSGLDIKCREPKLEDSSVVKLLNALSKKNISPAVVFDAYENSLTKVPILSKFSKLRVINLSGNQITSIPKGAFQSKYVDYVGIELQGNGISSIKAGAFNYPSATKAQLDLGYNNLNTIPSGVFKGNVTC